MRKIAAILLCSALLFGSCVYFLKDSDSLPFGLSELTEEENEEHEAENRLEKYRQEFEQMKDPSLNRIPSERLTYANEFTEESKALALNNRVDLMSWSPRGPIFDSIGPSNGNTRANGAYTSGMIPAFLVDTLNDPTGNTIFAGSSGGGLWKCTNFLSTGAPNWVAVNDFMANLGIAAICQDPSNPSVMYLATGDGNTLDVRGFGLFKSTDAGTTWTQLGTTAGFRYGFRLICDANGVVYFASGGSGLQRSNNGGANWTNIGPAGNTASNASYVTDLELSSTGRLHASFGYLGTAVRHYYTDIPATVTSAAGWNLSTGIRTSAVACSRLELAVQGNVLYGLTSNGSYNLDSSYKSVDGGATWTKQNTTVYPTAFGNGQGYYNITLNINPDNSNEFIAGGIDAYRTTNSGVNITRISNWVGSPYVHADHHFMQWFKAGSESRVIIACDGGMFLSRDGGVTWKDRNENLDIKQFYSAAIHPTAGTNYFIGGTQDNGSHQLKQAGLSYSHEVTGGDGAFVHINQQDPLVQFTSYVYNQYRRSVDGGVTWSSINPSTTLGYFINPFDYDDAQNIMYASNASSGSPNNTIRRWLNASTTTATTTIVVPELVRAAANSNASAFKMSPYTANRLFIGGSTGKVLRVENANTIVTGSVSPNVTDITGAAFPTGYIRCVNTGSSDQYLVATFTNYGIDNVWYSTDGGSSWTAIDGNLPDMPVWWAVFEPGNDNRLLLATETGVYATSNINGASTVWTANPSFPTVRTTMLKVRASDKTVVASTYGRGMFTAVIPSSTAPVINFTSPATTAKEDSLGTDGCRKFKDYRINVSLQTPATGNAIVTYSIQAGATAVQGRDFDFTTNGNFTTPSNQHVFNSGETGIKFVTVRVYEDAQIETNQSFTLTYTISGTTNAVSGTTNTHVFTIVDNDVLPGNASTNFQIGNTYTVNLNGNTSAFASNQLRHRLQYLYYASELKAAGIQTGGAITALTLRVATKNSTRPFLGFTISMGHTGSATVNTGFVPEPISTTVWTGSYSTVAGDNAFTFTTPFVWDGVSNVVVQYCFDNTSYGTAESLADFLEGNVPFPTGYWGSVFTNGPASSPCTAAAAQLNTARANMNIAINVNKPIATTLNSARSEYLNSNNDLYYYSTTGELMARITNLSGHNYGCTNVRIDRAGTGATAFWNADPKHHLTTKTWEVVPTTANASGQYQITLYYTAAEKAGWEAATGNSWSNIKMVKVRGKISDYTPSTPYPYGPNTVEIVTPTHGTHSTGYTLTYTFNTGFSGFAAGIPALTPLPVTLLSFTGKLDANNSALLNWSTSFEQNVKNFDIEKSTDGVSYYKIGSVTATGNSSTQRNYNFRDTRLAQNNYYRLRINDADGRDKLSNVVLIRSTVVAQNLWVVNNPFKGHIDLRFAKEAKTVKLQLMNAAGAVVEERVINNPASQSRWTLTSNVSQGVYILRAVVDGETFTHKVVKE